VALKAVFFDVGETLVDEERYWRLLAERIPVSPQVLWAALGVTIARGEDHTELWRHLGVERPAAWDELTYASDDLYPDALACLEALRARGLFVGVVGNQTAALEGWAREEALPADYLSSSASWGVRKPAPEFFQKVIEAAGAEPGEIAYVGDRVDNDVIPAAAAGLVAVHLRRGPWGMLQHAGAEAALSVGSLAELPAALASLG
jgi:HAD superfamily hydrolase (TIGR01509 family)